MKKALTLFALNVFVLSVLAQKSTDEQQVHKVVADFFAALEKQDTATFYNLHVPGAKFYVVAERNDTVRSVSRDVREFTFPKDEILKERMRDTGVVVQVHDRIATVWAPYDLWVNDKFSHCGVDAFTLLKTTNGWKIATCSYSVETKACK